MSPIILRPDDALTSKTVTVYTPPTCARGYRSRHAAYNRWAKDLILQSPEPELATAIRAIRAQRKVIEGAAAITSGSKKKACE